MEHLDLPIPQPHSLLTPLPSSPQVEMLSIKAARAPLRCRFRVAAVPTSHLFFRSYSVAPAKDVPRSKKVWSSAEEAVQDVSSGSLILSGGEQDSFTACMLLHPCVFKALGYAAPQRR